MSDNQNSNNLLKHQLWELIRSRLNSSSDVVRSDLSREISLEENRQSPTNTNA